MLNRMTFGTVVLGLALMLGGCAHPISMAPALSSIQPSADTPPVEKAVGYYLAPTTKELQVTTPGGGGDKVRYFPYRDLEPGLYKTLETVFRDVTKLAHPNDAAELQTRGIQWVLIPEIKTESSSDSLITWPPTSFTVTLTCQIKDAQGAVLDTVQAVGRGRAEFAEFSANFSLAAVRASEDALAKLIVALRQSPALAK